MGISSREIFVIYVDTLEERAIVVTLGDSIRAQDWARSEYPDDEALRAERSGMYGVFLAARRSGEPHTNGTWVDWLDLVTLPDDDEDEDAAGAEGDSDGPPSEA